MLKKIRELYEEMMAITAKEVGKMLSNLMFENLCKAGTMIKPPPTPNRPDIRPVIPPVNDRALAH